MLTCVPTSLCTWNYRVTGASDVALLTYNYFSEQGRIALGAAVFSVRKNHPFSGHWILAKGAQVFAEAHKPSLFTRSCEVRTPEHRITLKPQSYFTRSFDMCAGDRAVGTIRPERAFSRRAFVTCDAEIPELVQIFSFWMAVITWRRGGNCSGPMT